MRVLLLASALVLSQAPRKASVCTDIDFDTADVTVSNFGDDKYCCNLCNKDDASLLCCPTLDKDGTTIIIEVPYVTNNARQILDKDYLMYNVCQGSPGAELQGIIPPDKDGDVSYMKLHGVQTDPDVTAISLIFKNLTEYFPSWPVLGTCKKYKTDDKKKCKKFVRDYVNGDSLKPAGYLNNGRKTGTVQATDLLQVNLCENRILAMEVCFVDDDNEPVVLSNAAMRFFDIDHGATDDSHIDGPEVMQFMCTGGTFTLYGYEKDGAANAEFLVHMSHNAQALKRPDTGELTVNGLPINVYDCPNNEWVTIWSSRAGVGKDNPTSSIIEANTEFGMEQEQSMVQIDFVEQDCAKVTFANMPVAYHVHLKDTADDVKIAKLYASLEVTAANYPDVGTGDCEYDTSGRNWLFAGLKSESRRDCTPPPSPPPPPPPPLSPSCDLSQCAHGQFASSPDPDAPPTWHQPKGNEDCRLHPDGKASASLLYDQGRGVTLAKCKAACEGNPLCTDITWYPPKMHCRLFEGCDNPKGSTGLEHWVPTPTALSLPSCTDTNNGATGGVGKIEGCLSLTPNDCDASNEFIDDDDFTASTMCCACGGGVRASLPLPSTCETCHPSCDSCTGPDAGDCTKCPYLCDPTCDKESSPSYAEWGLGDSSGKFKCLPCDPSCTSCTGPDADQCTTCNEECDVSQCKHGQYPHGSECKDCDPSCEFCTGPGANECATCPKSCEISDCKNGEYLMGTKCEKCDASCTASGQGYGESCVGPEAGDCVKCPYECDVSCAAYADKIGQPMYADWSLGNLDCQPCASECGKSAEIDGASCTGPSKDECTTCFPPKACALSQCANGEYAIGTKCEKCDASCTKSGQGYGESCTGPGARDCVKCPYECDDTCSGSGIAGSGQYANWIAPNGVYFSPECKMCSTECVGNGDADKTGAGCTGPSKDECTTCISPPPPSPPADPPPLPPADPPPSPPMDPAPSAPAVPETTTCGKTADFPNYEAACGMGDYQDSTGSCEPCDPCCEWGGGCSGGSPGTADCTSCFYKGGPPPATATCDKSCPAKCKEQGLDCGILPACTGCALAFTTVMAAAAADCVIAAAPDAPPSPPALPMPGAQIFDDPHVRTLSGNQFFMHGVGVFDYASIPNVISTQVYMCPFAPCTADMMEMGDCLTFIQAVAVKIEKGHANGHGANEHVVVWRNNAMRIDGDDRKAESNITLGGQSSIRASGRGSATAHPDRVQHESLADCHVLSTKGQPDVLSTPAKDGQRLKASEPYPRQYIEQRAEVDVPMQKGTAGWAWADRGVPLSKGEKQANDKAGSAVPQGGVWAECTNNEWTLSTKQMTIDVGVIGPFEKGYLREAVSDRTFNLNVLNVADKDALQGIINGDKNGLFKVMEDLNPPTGGPVDENVGALVPKGPHGAVQEVTAANVAPDKVLFSTSTMREMDRACGEQQSLRAIRLDKEGEPSVDVKMWKDFKRRSVD